MRTLHRLWPYVKKYRAAISAGLACLVAVDVIQLIFPLLMAHAVDALKIRNLSEVHRALAWLAGLAVLIVAIRYLWRLLLLGASRKIERDLRDDFFRKLLRAPQPFLDGSRSGDLLSLSTNDIAVVRQFLGFGLMSLGDAVVLISFSIFLMFTLSVPLTLLVAVPLPLITLAMLKLGIRLHDAHEETQNQFGDLSARLQEDLYGVRVIRAYGQEQNRQAAFTGAADAYRRKIMYVTRLQGLFYPLLKVLAGAATVLVLWFGGLEVIRGRLTLGQFVAFTEYVAMLSWPLMALGWIINLVQRARASMGRLNRVFEVSDAAGGREDLEPAPAFRTLEVRDLTQDVGFGAAHGDSSEPFRFDGVRLVLRRGEWVGLAGRTACGKSSLVSRVLRIYEPPAGAIFLDGVDVTRIDPRALRERISYVPQEGFLFSQSLLSNFKLGSRNIPEESVAQIADIVQMKDEIDRFPDRLKSRVGERGITLSGGQRQRVAVGRALLKDADFYIFDDPFSCVDLDTEERVFERMKTLLAGRGVLMITHRVQTLARMDRIVFIDAGRTVETGTHAELLARRGMYARFVEAQELKERLEAAV
ncbi:MAG: hypothetical protein A3G34_14675 [Candidatus Lindowbacteria bacterium RIFCSPLOWO2_12_FULL_62_27]|nr:MAG: hypothetical protein A3I06_14645 [Candidatus Lindowbacteria bacterium RIFCSPLOWO2_02_FULL_62_12]OGH63103.1 MAG: hypothetical protein A3G34_14675 [Candidatus Lindowbacteria bacterium RIFCSPLOWO2_12_FULL_62_27]